MSAVLVLSRRPSQPRMVALYTLTIFVGAMLLFGVQPMFARLILPQLGGSPAVWNTAMVFFQAVLLAGYAYAHASTTRLGARRQSGWHLAVLLAPLCVLPLAIPAGWSPPVEGNPAPWLLALMTVSVGLPFFALSTTSPVLQKWFACSGHRRAGDPYFLYAASNIGSLLSLLAYPLLVEPRLTLAEQTRAWTAGYVMFVVLVFACAAALRRTRSATNEVEANTALEAEPATPAPTNAARLRWVALSFVPSSLLLGVTTYVSTEVAVVPLLWVLPLALYLLTFALVFARRQWVSVALLTRALPLILVPVVMVLAVQATQPIVPLAALHLALLFVAAWLCHARLAASRPAAAHLTEFYLWISVGGVLGGIFNALLAPVLFQAIIEYPITLVLACLVALPKGKEGYRALAGDWLWPLGLAALACMMLRLAQIERLQSAAAISRFSFGALALICFFFSRRRLRLALGVTVILVSGDALRRQAAQVLVAERSFFGVHRVLIEDSGEAHKLLHGKILHGMQRLAPTEQREPLTYYHRSGPVGQIMLNYAKDSSAHVAVIGLGAGSMAAYAKAGQSWCFYEIDPVVLRLARDTRYFTFLADSRGTLDFVLGDARLSLVGAADGAYDLLVLDAYSSDAIPVHLVTREALALYARKLSMNGVLAFHISNLNLDLEPVFGNLAADAGFSCLVCDDTGVSPVQLKEGKSPSVWLVMARRPADIAALAHDSRWQPARRIAGQAVWTDDYSSLLSVVRWR